ncbi:hypothetical protein ACFFX0_04945 [Citricoccus parietis]|uniref:Uncharacterized protein n=1 Tax=Citricoccus parietis TaxID=592307 RepID=A0ABV5FV89_9MICC
MEATLCPRSCPRRPGPGSGPPRGSSPSSWAMTSPTPGIWRPTQGWQLSHVDPGSRSAATRPPWWEQAPEARFVPLRLHLGAPRVVDDLLRPETGPGQKLSIRSLGSHPILPLRVSGRGDGSHRRVPPSEMLRHPAESPPPCCVGVRISGRGR